VYYFCQIFTQIESSQKISVKIPFVKFCENMSRRSWVLPRYWHDKVDTCLLLLFCECT